MAITARPHGIAGIIGILPLLGFTGEALLRIQPLWLSPIYGFHLVGKRVEVGLYHIFIQNAWCYHILSCSIHMFCD